MIGGEKTVVDRLDPIFAALAPGRGDIPVTPTRKGRDPRVEKGYLHAGPSGAGHFVKMIHNGIEYGMMQAIAEGFDILQARQLGEAAGRPAARSRRGRHRRGVAPRQRGHVVAARSDGARRWRRIAQLAGYSGYVEDSGEGRWTVQAAIEEAVPAEVLTSCALHALPLAAGPHVRREGALGHAQGVRRACRAEEVSRWRRDRARARAARPRDRADGRLGLGQEHDGQAARAPRSIGRSATPTAFIRTPTSTR